MWGRYFFTFHFTTIKKATTIILIIVVALLVGAGYWYVDYLSTKRLPGLLGDRIAVNKVKIDVKNRRVQFDAPLFQMDSIKDQPNLTIAAEAKFIAIEGFSFIDLIFNKEIGVDMLEVDSAFIHVQLPEDELSMGGKKEINLFVRELFTSINLHEFNFRAARISVAKHNAPDSLFVVTDFTLKAEEIIIDTATVSHVFPLDFKNSEISAGKFRMQAGELYSFSGGKITVQDTAVRVQDVIFASRFDRETFVSKLEYEKAQIDLSVKEVYAENVVWSLDDGFSLHSTKANIDQATLKVYKDKRPPPQPIKVKPMMQELIRKLPFTLTLDTAQVKDSYIEYEQYPVMFPRSGSVYFDNTYASLYNLTNDSSLIEKQPELIVDVQCQFMGKGDLKTQIRLDLASPDNKFSVSGHLSELPVTYVNQVMTPLVGVTAEGTVHSLDFSFEGDNYDANGQLVSDYSDLKITIYDDGRDKEFFKTLFGNIVLRNNNHKDSLGYKEGKIYFVRYQNKDFFNYLWNSVREGIMDVAIPFYKNGDENRDHSQPKYKIDD